MENPQRIERQAFVVWLTTGRWLRAASPGPSNRKFNHNHDPANGQFTSGGGSSGGASSSRSGEGDASDTIGPPTAVATEIITRTIKPVPAAASKLRHVIRNGYDYGIDVQDRTRTVSGTLTLELAPRSRSAQAEAGGTDRLPTDEGEHYIARRFNGPTETFDHFAQDASTNRGRYRALENEWAMAKRGQERHRSDCARICRYFQTATIA